MHLKRTKNGTVFFVYSVVFLVFIKPEYFGTIPVLDMCLNLLRVITVFASFFVCFVFKKKTKISLGFIWVILYALMPVVITILSFGDIDSALRCAFLIVGITIFYCCISKKNEAIALRALALVTELIVYINFMTIIFYPNGMWLFATEQGWASRDVWFLGLRNSHATPILLACAASVLNTMENRTKINIIRMLLVHIISVLTMLRLISGGGLVAFFFYFLLIIAFFGKKHIKNWGETIKKRINISFQTIVIIHIIAFLGITAFSATSVFMYFFALFGKGATVIKRAVGWTEVWSRVLERPLLGYGYLNSSDLLWMQNLFAGATTCHNTMLDILFRSGILTFIFFILYLFAIGRHLDSFLDKSKNKYGYIWISFFCIFLTLQSEGSMGSPVLFIFLNMISLIEQKKE